MNTITDGKVSLVDVVVVGAGQAGLGIGFHLSRAGVDFVILERGEIGESWRSQRWDSFAVNTPNWMNGLPGSPYEGTSPHGFYQRDELVSSLERHATTHGLPIRRWTAVERVAAVPGSPSFAVDTVDRNGLRDSIRTRNVVVASGMMHSPKVPAMAASLPDSIKQLHASDYRSASALPDGAIIVVGSGQSGCQIAEDLTKAGRTVYLSTSKVARVPRRYRGRDALEWMDDLGMWDQRVEDLADPLMQFAAQPQVSGVGPRGRTVSLQALHGQGVRLMGRITSVIDGLVVTDDGLADHIAFADRFSREFKRKVDAHVHERVLNAPTAELDPFDVPAGPEVTRDGLTTLDLESAGVSAAIWCTGFTSNLDWLDVPVIDGAGNPVHVRGVSPLPGIYFLGFPWLHTRKSGIIFGIDEDARHVAEAIVDGLS